jgi:hypothetical protein
MYRVRIEGRPRLIAPSEVECTVYDEQTFTDLEAARPFIRTVALEPGLSVVVYGPNGVGTTYRSR